MVEAGDTLDHAADPEHAWWVDRLLYTPVHLYPQERADDGTYVAEEGGGRRWSWPGG